MGKLASKSELVMIYKIIYIIFITIAFSQNESILILQINVEGNHRLSKNDVIRNARLYEQMEIEGPEIQQAIKRLWKLNRFENIQIIIDYNRYNVMTLYCKIKPNCNF